MAKCKALTGSAVKGLKRNTLYMTATDHLWQKGVRCYENFAHNYAKP